MNADWVIDDLVHYIAERWQITEEEDIHCLRMRILSLPPSASDELAQAKKRIAELEAANAQLKKDWDSQFTCWH